MKRNEIIELNGVEYTLELNRESYLAIDKVCDINKCMNILYRNIYDTIDNIPDNYDPYANLPSEEDIDKEIELKLNTLKTLSERTLFVCLYPNHKLSLNEVKELIKPCLEDEEKKKWLAGQIGNYIRICIEIRDAYNEERKNLQALTNK